MKDVQRYKDNTYFNKDIMIKSFFVSAHLFLLWVSSPVIEQIAR